MNDARARLLDVISFTECANQNATPDALLDAYRDQVLTEAMVLLRQHDGDEWWYDTRDRDAAVGLLAAVRTNPQEQS